jgi:hypothetical protein
MSLYLRATIAIFVLLAVQPAVATTLKGVVVKDEAGGPPVAGVEITSPGANRNVTLPDGQFRLDYPEKKIGDMVHLFVRKDGYVVVNDVLLEPNLPSSPDTKPFLIIVCLQGKREEMASRFYRLKSLDTIEEYYQRRLKELENMQTADARTIEDVRAQLLQERNQAEKEAEEASDAVARLQPGDTGDAFAQAMALFLKGDIQGARGVLGKWTEVSANLLTLLNTPPEPTSVALSRLIQSLQGSPDASGFSNRLFQTLDARRIDSDHMFYAIYAFYLATNDPRWKEEIFSHLFVSVRIVTGLLDRSKAGISPFSLRDFVNTKWSKADRFEFLTRCLDIVEPSGGGNEAVLNLLDSLVAYGELADMVRNDRTILSRIIRLCHREPHDILVRIAPEAFLVFVAGEIVNLDNSQVQNDLPPWDTAAQAAVDYPPAFERSDFAQMMAQVSWAAGAAPTLRFPVDVGDVGVEGYHHTDVIYVSAVRKWWSAHQKEVQYWNNF